MPASSTLTSAPYLFKQLSYDPAKDFAAVTTIASLSFMIAVDAARPVRNGIPIDVQLPRYSDS